MINYTFLESPYHCEFKYANIFAKFSKTELYSRKTENVKILFKGTCANNCKISS